MCQIRGNKIATKLQNRPLVNEAVADTVYCFNQDLVWICLDPAFFEDSSYVGPVHENWACILAPSPYRRARLWSQLLRPVLSAGKATSRRVVSGKHAASRAGQRDAQDQT